MKSSSAEQLNRVLPRVEAPADYGLTAAQAKERLENGYGNGQPNSASKTLGQIIVSNVCTYFNLIFVILAVFIILVGSYNDLMFMPIVIVNTLIGIIQEYRSKRATDKLSIVSAPQATLIRDGTQVAVPTAEAVRDDIAVFSAGEQIYADAVIIKGSCHVNEALVTGEADEIGKEPGDSLFSGSYVVSGQCTARLDKVGEDSFVSRLTGEAKKTKKKKKSEMLRELNLLLQIIGVMIIPIGILMYIQQTSVLQKTTQEAVVSTVGALVGMIPEGLFLLVSVALVVSILRLAKKKTLVHEMGCIETLARVNVLCVDKTGTITENKMTVEDIVPLQPECWDENFIRALMNDYVGNMGADNDTMAALRRYFTGETKRSAEAILPFSSSVKYGGINFGKDHSWLVGAPELIMREGYNTIRETVEKYSSMGCRVLLLAQIPGKLPENGLNVPAEAVSLILLTNKIRAEAHATFRFFQKQGVKIIVISGDNPVTVSQVALEAGIEGAEKYIDATVLTTERKIKHAIRDTVVFGRVTPEKKRKLIQALKAEGNTVAMTGDGVNDILAMKDADCSIAMASGSEVASQVAQLVLLDSRFSSLPAVVMEGRRVINNIERSASLFLTKNIFSFILAITALILALGYPLAPSQLSLMNMTCIGIPSFVLALEFNKDLVRGKFLKNVLLRAAPAGLADFSVVLSAMYICKALNYSGEILGTMATVLVSFVGFIVVFRTCLPFNSIRKLLFGVTITLFVLCSIFLPGLYSLSPMPGKAWFITVGLMAAALVVLLLFSRISYLFGAKRPPKIKFPSIKNG